MSFTSLSNAATEIVVGLLLVIAAVVVVYGLVRAYLTRRRTQLVITDVVRPDELPASLVAELSATLRRDVHRRLVKGSKLGESLGATVGKDITNHIVTIKGVDKDAVERIQQAILDAPGHELLSTQRDALAAVSGGIRALKPSQAEGIIQAVSAALPGQRGVLVSTRALTRPAAGGTQVGLSIEIGPLNRGPEAWATFWSGDGAASDAAAGFALPRGFDRVLALAVEWITVYLIGTVGVDAPRWWLPGLLHRRMRNQRHALRDILTAQWASYAMWYQQDLPVVALQLADQALEDAADAARILPDYYYPHYIAATIHDLRGRCYADLADSTPGGDSYRADALASFTAAVDAYGRAEDVLQAVVDTEDFHRSGKSEAWQHLVTRIRMERIKDRLFLARERAEALTELEQNDLEPYDDETTFNAACVFAVAARAAEDDGRDGSKDRERACRYLLDVVRRAPVAADDLRKERDLLRGIAREDLDWLLDVAPTADEQTVELRLAQIVGRAEPARAGVT